MDKPPHILIAGAGIGGLTLATVLAQHGARVDVFERATELGDIGAGIQQSPNAMHVHEAIGTARALEAIAFEPEAIIFRDYKTGNPLITSRLEGVCQDRYGQKYLHVHRADMLTILRKAAEDAGAVIHFGHAVEAYQQNKDGLIARVNGQAISGDILVGADGIHSAVREHMLGAQPARFTEHVAWRGLVPTKNLPDNLIPPAANNWLGPDRHFVSYYVRGGTAVNFVAVQERDAWADESWNVPGNLDELRAAFAGWDTRIEKLLQSCESCYLWGLFDREVMPSWVDGRAALIGDAAHPMLPFLAQGAAMAAEDGWVLAQKILTCDGDYIAALKSYELARRKRATVIQHRSRETADLYHAKSPFAEGIRRLKFKVADHIPAIANARLDKVFGVNVVRDYPIPPLSND